MKQFLETKLFLTLQDASQKGIDTDAKTLENSYDEFVMRLFSEGAASTNRAAYHNTLVYTRAELAGLAGVSEKKCNNLFAKSL
jgi:hypothetical protein